MKHSFTVEIDTGEQLVLMTLHDEPNTFYFQPGFCLREALAVAMDMVVQDVLGIEMKALLGQEKYAALLRQAETFAHGQG